MSANQRGMNLRVRVVRVRDLISRGLGSCEAATVQLIESLLWTLLAWTPLDVVGECLFIRSMIVTGRVLMSMRDEKDSDQTFLKAWTNYLMCTVIEDQTGGAPRPKRNLFVGFVWSRVRRLLARRDVSFFYSLLQSKRFWPQLGLEKRWESIQDSKSRLLTPGPSRLSEEAVEEIMNTSSEVFRSLPPPTKMAPSSSACYQASVRDGGAYSLFAPMESWLSTDTMLALSSELPFHPTVQLGKLRDSVLSHEAWKRRTFERADRESRNLVAGVERMHCTVQLIPEPSKFRTITKGDGFLYTRLQPLQGAMLSAWKKMPSSTMVGELDEKVVQLAKSPEPFWCSGDFKAATDTLDQLATLAAACAVDQVTGSRVCSNAMMPSVLEFPDGSVGLQVGGQLMGHPLSFPLLCVINLALYRLAVRRYCRVVATEPGTRRRLMSQVLINGDDILFKCDATLYRIWTETVAEAGLIISPGKNYLSRHFFTINSRLYEDFGRGVRRIGYLNLKLVKGFSLKTGESAATPDQIGKDVSEMVRLCPKSAGCIPAAFERFRYPGWQPNWYLPVSLGGYGVDPAWMPDSGRITREQRVMAAVFRNEKLSLFKKKTDCFDSVIAELQRLSPSFEWLPSSEENEVADEWTGRLAEIAYAMKGGAFVASERETSTWVAGVRLRKSKAFKPMSVKKITEYWSDRLVPAEWPPVPPPGVLSY